jgi:D-lactate dehydrogenase
LKTGVLTTKGVVGYDLTRLIVGSEGTLALITEATLKLTPRSDNVRTLRAVYRNMAVAAKAVSRIMAQPIIPCALEFMDDTAIDLARRYANTPLPQEAGGLLMIEVDGPAAYLSIAVQAVSDAARGEGLLSLDIAESAAEIASLWQARKSLSPILRKIAPKKINEDVVVPVSRIPDLIEGLGRLSRKHGIRIVNFGHAGNGNIHVNLLYDPADPAQATEAEQCLSAVFDLVLALEGTLSGEHGVGLDKRDFVIREIDPSTLEMMSRTKAQFDPQGILNPEKALPATDGAAIYTAPGRRL